MMFQMKRHPPLLELAVLEEALWEEWTTKKLGITSTKLDKLLLLPKKTLRKINGKKWTKCQKCHLLAIFKLSMSMKMILKMSQKVSYHLTKIFKSLLDTKKDKLISTIPSSFNNTLTTDYKIKLMKFRTLWINKKLMIPKTSNFPITIFLMLKTLRILLTMLVHQTTIYITQKHGTRLSIRKLKSLRTKWKSKITWRFLKRKLRKMPRRKLLKPKSRLKPSKERRLKCLLRLTHTRLPFKPSTWVSSIRICQMINYSWLAKLGMITTISTSITLKPFMIELIL